MTDLNKYNPYPDSFVMRCPKCAGPAEFRFAFTLVSPGGPKPPRRWPTTEETTWGGWTVVQHDPVLYPWKPPAKGGYIRSDHGIRACTACGGRFPHKLSWPKDAYFKCDVRGQTLWAWSIDHARVLRDFIASVDRDPTKHKKYFLFLRHIPEHFIRAKNREIVLKRLTAMIEKEA